MIRSKRNLRYHELIGLQAKIKDHVDPSLIGIEGEVINETMKMLELRSGNIERKVPKEGGVFLFKLGRNQTVEIRGDDIMGRPVDRLKKVRR